MRKPEATIGAMVRNIYRGPLDERLQLHAPDGIWLGDVWARVRISRIEIRTATVDEGAFIGILSARLVAAVDEMVDRLHAQTFPVHDEPWVEPVERMEDERCS